MEVSLCKNFLTNQFFVLRLGFQFCRRRNLAHYLTALYCSQPSIITLSLSQYDSNYFERDVKYQGPVVQSIVSLTGLLVVKMLIVLVSTISNSVIFAEKMQMQKLLTFFSKNISVYTIFNDQVTPASVAQLDGPSDWRPGGRGFNPRRGRQLSFVEIDHEIFSMVILSLPLIQEGQLSVSGERMCTILVNRLED